jgi:hypothetical protein
VADHLASEHLGLSGRVDHTDTSLETIVELTLTTATGENLGLDNKIITTNGLGNSLSLFGSFGDITLGNTNTVLDC